MTRGGLTGVAGPAQSGRRLADFRETTLRVTAACLIVFVLSGWGGSAFADPPVRAPKVIAAGKLTLAGRAMRCGGTPTLMSSTFWDFGGSGRGMIILNPTKLETLPLAVRLFVYEHECGHQILGVNELKADCYAIDKGRRDGWLDAASLSEVCAFFADSPGDWVHPPGPERCRYVTQCFTRAAPPRAGR